MCINLICIYFLIIVIIIMGVVIINNSKYIYGVFCMLGIVLVYMYTCIYLLDYV